MFIIVSIDDDKNGEIALVDGDIYPNKTLAFYWATEYQRTMPDHILIKVFTLAD